MCHGNRRAQHRRRAFSLVELLVVIALIAVLVAILVPVVGRVRSAARVAQTQAFIAQLSTAIDSYHGDFRAYPGPISNANVYNANVIAGADTPAIDTTANTEGFETDQSNFHQKITMSENLVLGLMGGLRRDTTTPRQLRYDPRLVSGGANSLNTTGPTRRHKAYITDAKNLSWRTDGTPSRRTGHYRDAAGQADDTIIPEFVDTFTDPLPILYMRAKTGAPPVPEIPSLPLAENAGVISYHIPDTKRVGQYDLHQIIAYTNSHTGDWPTLADAPDPKTGSSIGIGKATIDYYVNGQLVDQSSGFFPYHGLQDVIHGRVPAPMNDPNYNYPFEAYLYLRNPALSTDTAPIPYQKNGYILISAGADRIYGTRDDITNFGGVAQ